MLPATFASISSSAPCLPSAPPYGSASKVSSPCFGSQSGSSILALTTSKMTAKIRRHGTRNPSSPCLKKSSFSSVLTSFTLPNLYLSTHPHPSLTTSSPEYRIMVTLLSFQTGSSPSSISRRPTLRAPSNWRILSTQSPQKQRRGSQP